MSKPDHDTMMRLIRENLSKETRKVVTHTVWKDSIDVDFPDHDIEAFYSAVRNETIAECAIAARQIDRVGYEWVKDSLWDNITGRASDAVRNLKT